MVFVLKHCEAATFQVFDAYTVIRYSQTGLRVVQVAGRADGQTGRFASSFSQFVEKNNDVFVWAVRKRTEGIFFVEFMLHWCFSAERLVAQQAFGNSFVQALAFWDVAHNLYNDVAVAAYVYAFSTFLAFAFCKKIFIRLS